MSTCLLHLADISLTQPLDPLVVKVKDKIKALEYQFKILRRSTRGVLQRRRVDVKLVVERLTELRASDMPNHKVFLKENLYDLFRADGIIELFGMMNTYWNYLSYQLLAHLIKEFGVEEVKEGMKKYKIDLRQFLEETPIKLFCEAQSQVWVHPPKGFQEMAVKFSWTENTMLSKVEEFRQKYVCNYNLRECALLLIQITIGSFTVAWFIPDSVVDRLSSEVDDKFLTNFAVSSLEIGGRSVYLKQKPEEVRFLLFVSK